MKKISHVFVFILFVILAGCAHSKPDSRVTPQIALHINTVESRGTLIHQPFGKDRIALLENELANIMTATNARGISACIGIPDKGMWCSARGITGNPLKEKITPDMPFCAGSIGKIFTAVVILNLIEEDRLGLENSIEKWFPEFDRAGDITINHLLTHTSGIAGFDNAGEYESHKDLYRNPEKLLSYLAGKKLLFEPGKHYAYSNTGYLMLGIIIERVTGKSYKEAVEHYIIKKIDLHNTRVITSETVHDLSIKGHHKGTVLSASEFFAVPFAAGSIAATPGDLITFLQALMSGRLLSKDSLQSMFSDMNLMTASQSTYHGKGVIASLDTPAGHIIGYTGGLKGFGAALYYHPGKNIFVCVMMNDDIKAVDPAMFKLLETMSGSYYDLFEETVGIIEKHFYNPAQIERDFPAIKKRYHKQLSKISTHENFSSLMNAMLHELNASHTYYLTPDNYEYYQLAALFSKIPDIGALFQEQKVMYPTVGIMTHAFKGKVFIVSVLAGSIAEKAGLLEGDEILSVNGASYSPIVSLRSSVGSNVTFEIRRQEQARPVKIDMIPQQVNPKQEMLDAQKASVRIIEQAGKRIGYVHMYSYAGEEYHQELMNALVWGELKNADALIIDLRYGLGGAWPYYLNIFNRNIPVLEMIDRDGRKSIVDSQWRKPAVYLVNAFSRSGKELLAFGAGKYNMVTVMGEPTAGQSLGGRLFPLSNRDMLFLAVQSSLIDGVNLEGVGVKPDIEIPFDVRYCSGHDVQLEKSVEYLIDQLSTIDIRNKK